MSVKVSLTIQAVNVKIKQVVDQAKERFKDELANCKIEIPTGIFVIGNEPPSCGYWLEIIKTKMFGGTDKHCISMQYDSENVQIVSEDKEYDESVIWMAGQLHPFFTTVSIEINNPDKLATRVGGWTCKYCGYIITDNDYLCTHCGAPRIK